MPEELGKIEKPKADEFKKGRKLFFVPLIFSPVDAEKEYQEMFHHYWEEAQAHLFMLEERLSFPKKLYHELIPDGEDKGAEAVEKLNSGSYLIIKSHLDRGSKLMPLEDEELLKEFIDWGRCLAAGLQSKTAFTTVYNAYAEVQKKRNERMSKQIDETLEDEETGILLMREGHPVPFPPDIQVFYVLPPVLDKIKRWVRDHEETAHNKEG